ncbi:MAG: hypothetical protein VW338_16925 [Rhodospirillaceae bacterium]
MHHRPYARLGARTLSGTLLAGWLAAGPVLAAETVSGLGQRSDLAITVYGTA